MAQRRSTKKKQKIPSFNVVFSSETYSPEVAVYQLSDEKINWGYCIRYFGENIINKKEEVSVIYSQRTYNLYEDAILDAIEVLDILGFELEESNIFEINEFRNKKYNKIYVEFDGKNFNKLENE